MSNYLIEAILVHRKVRVIYSKGFIYACRTSLCISNGEVKTERVNVTGYTLKQLEDYLNN